MEEIVDQLAALVLTARPSLDRDMARDTAEMILGLDGIGDAIRRAYIAGTGVLTRSESGFDSPEVDEVRIFVAGRH